MGLTAALAVSLAACSPSAGPPPVISLDAKKCTAASTDATPRPLQLGEENAVTVDIDNMFPCRLDRDGKPYIEILFQLPDVKQPYLVRVMSLPMGQTMFSPRVTLLSGTGSVTRELPPDAFRIHAPSLSAIVRVQPTDRLLRIASNAAPVGEQQTQISEQTNTTVVATGTGFFLMRTGAEGQTTYTLAYNGRIRVSATPLPISDPAAILGSSGSRPSP